MSFTRYRIPAAEHVFEQEIKHSRFIATVIHAPTIADAKAAIQQIAARYPDATHNCWAYVAGVGPHADIGSSDDGEPSGTAGRPMLLVLQNSGIGEIAAVVTRYYGGVKLGTGGLVRAYGGTLQKALNDAPTSEQVVRRIGMVSLEYSQFDSLKRLLQQFDARIDSEDFSTDVTLVVAIPADQWEPCAAAIHDWSNATLELLPVE